jgi:hypothetical protein
MTAVLDHLAIGTPALAGGWELFGGLLGGTWAYLHGPIVVGERNRVQ